MSSPPPRRAPRTRADNGDDRSEFVGNGAPCARLRSDGQRTRQKLRVQRLDDVFSNPCAEQVAIEADLVAITDGNDGNAGLAHLGKGMDLRYRKLYAADVDDQNVGRPLGAKGFHGLSNAAAADRRI